MPNEQVEIHLRFEGPDVDGGSMSIEDIVPVLQGFSGAYSRLASEDDPDSTHRVRITGVRRGSADIVLEVWKSAPDLQTTIASAFLTAVAGEIVKKIISVITLKKHVKREPYTERINATNSIVVTNSQNVTIEVPLKIFEIFKGGDLDSDLSKVVRPLEAGRVDSAEISMTNASGEKVIERIEAEERPYFDIVDATVTSTSETWLLAKLNSFTKSTSNGWLNLRDGRRVFYKYIGSEPTKFLSIFRHNGPVRILCTAFMDADLQVTRVDIADLEVAQSELFLSGESN